MNVFEPFSTHSPPLRTAVVLVPPASEPALFSVRPQQPTFSPWARGVRNFFFCSSVPARKMWPEQRLLWAATERATPASTRAQLLHDDGVVERGHARTAVFGRPDDAHEAHLAQLA